MEFNPHPHCQDCGAELNWPGSYSTSMDAVEYNCSMCGMMEGVTYVKPTEMPTEYLHRLYTYASRIDASIKRDEKDPRFEDLRAALQEELNERDESVEDVTLTHVVQTNKARANEIEEEFPGFFTIGSTPEDADYEFGTPREEMEWESMVSADEAEQLAQWDEVTVKSVS